MKLLKYLVLNPKAIQIILEMAIYFGAIIFAALVYCLVMRDV